MTPLRLLCSWFDLDVTHFRSSHSTSNVDDQLNFGKLWSLGIQKIDESLKCDSLYNLVDTSCSDHDLYKYVHLYVLYFNGILFFLTLYISEIYTIPKILFSELCVLFTLAVTVER